MGDKLVAREHSVGRLPEGDNDVVFLFTLKTKGMTFIFIFKR